MALLLGWCLAGCSSEASSTAEYRLPWPDDIGKQAVVQGFYVVEPTTGSCVSGCATHRDKGMAFALDVALTEGMPVLAARAGTVGLVAGSWAPGHCGGLVPVADPPPGYLVSTVMGNQANFVRIDHGDGTSALYLHLHDVAPEILVKARTGGSVVVGEVLGRSGRTGFTQCVPHLHFQVQSTARADWFTESLPVHFVDRDVVAQAPDGVPLEGSSYLSDNVPVPGAAS